MLINLTLANHSQTCTPDNRRWDPRVMGTLSLKVAKGLAELATSGLTTMGASGSSEQPLHEVISSWYALPDT